MTLLEEVIKLRKEARILRQSNASLTNTKQKQRTTIDKLREEVSELKKRKLELEKQKQQAQEEIEKLQNELSKLTDHKNNLAGMLFKTNVKSESKQDSKKRGGQHGHLGTSRTKPLRIDQEKTSFLSHCPDCEQELDRSQTYYERIVEDIPPQATIVTRYHIERQWCKACRKEVYATPKDTLPNFRFGTNLLTLVLFQKYRLRLPLNKIQESLLTQYDLSIAESGLQGILHRLKEYFGPEYTRILTSIRNAPFKHADETGWRIEGQNGWGWLFAIPKAAYYTLEETRGKGVPQKVLPEQSGKVLIRDDYGGYKKLDMEHQSCWTHLLRVSREATKREDASKETLTLHNELKRLFGELKSATEQPFCKEERIVSYDQFAKRLQTIRERVYLCKDAQVVQTRIRNQGSSLITALLYEGVPLTNNHAEQQIRTLAVIRKISGGSRSQKGASTTAVNLSVIQTLALRKEKVLDGLRKLLILPRQRYCLEEGE
jgi:transposase